MKVSCPSCQTNYNIDDKRIPPGGAKLKCAKCQTTFPIKANQPAAAAAPAAVAPISVPVKPVVMPTPFAAVPLPGAADPHDSSSDEDGDWEDQATRVFTLPLPTAAFPNGAPPPGGSAAVPLPGAGAPSRADDAMFAPPVNPPAAASNGTARAGKAVPLPGASAPPPAARNEGSPSAPAAGRTSVPLPGSAASPVAAPGRAAVPLPGSAVSPAAATGRTSVPLPGSAVSPPTPAARDALPLPGARHAGAQSTGNRFDVPAAVPLPGRAAEEDSFGIDDTGVEAPADQGYAGASAGGSSTPYGSGDTDFSLEGMPPPAEQGADGAYSLDDARTSDSDFGAVGANGFDAAPAASPFDDDNLPSPAAAPPLSFDYAELPEPEAAAPARSAFDDDNLPSPASASPDVGGSMEFEDLPPPEGDAPMMEFENLPSPASAEAQSLDFAEAAAPAADAEAFGLDFQEPPHEAPPDAAEAAAPAAVNPSADFGDIDFGDPNGAPATTDPVDFDPGPAGADAAGADNLELLDFNESAAKSAAPSRFHIRRRSGKVFGPFDEGVIVKMLEDGQLLGNEDVSTDSESWSGIATVSAFGAAVSKMGSTTPGEASASGGAAATTTDAPGTTPAATQSMDKLKQAYESRMAAVSVVDTGVPGARLKKLIPVLAIGAAVLVVLGTGFGMGATRYGFFGLKGLLPSKVSAGTPEFTALEKARRALLTDTYKGYQQARDLAATALVVKEFPEARAVWDQAVFYLHRRYSAASAAELATAKSSLEHVILLGKHHPEVVKAHAGSLLSANDGAGAVALLDEAIARDSSSDPELAFLRAEGYSLKKETKASKNALTALIKQNPKSAKAHHALGDLHQAAKEADLAAKAYEAALAADPDHVVSAVELAALELLVKKNLERGDAAVEQALTPVRRSLLGPAELARATALKGEALALQFKPKEAAEKYEEALKLDPNALFVKGGLARVLLSQREYAKALPYLEAVVEREPGNLEYTEGYLSALIATGKMDTAAKQVALANQRFAGNARIAFLFGRISEALEQNKEAESNYLRAANADPTLYEANLALARMYLKLKRPDEARTQLEGALAKEPENGAVHAGLGELALSEGEFEKAQFAFEKALSVAPTLADAHLGASKVALARGQLEQALSAADKALEYDAHLKGGRLQRGQVLWRLNKLDASLSELDKAHSEEPKNTRVSVTLGAVRLEKGDLKNALPPLLGALSQEPGNADAHFYLAKVKSRQGEHAQAIDSMRTAIEYAPKRPELHYEFGLILRDAKRIAEAMEEWKLAVEKLPAHAEALEALGLAYLAKGELDAAITHFEKVLAVDASRTRVTSLVGDAHFQAGRWNESISRYQKALTADPAMTQLYYKIARAYSEKGQNGQAVTWYRKATGLEPTNPMPFYYLGFAFKETGRKREAIESFRTYLEKKPDADDKQEIEDEIYDLEH